MDEPAKLKKLAEARQWMLEHPRAKQETAATHPSHKPPRQDETRHGGGQGGKLNQNLAVQFLRNSWAGVPESKERLAFWTADKRVEELMKTP